MTEEFDEDVVFENSPLFQYLHDLGHTDFEACPTASQEEEYYGQEGDVTSPHEDPQKTSCGWSFVSICQPCDELDCVFGQYSVKCILDQDVLLQEDVELIELLDPSLLTLGSSCNTQNSVLLSPLRDTAGLIGLAAVLLGLCATSGGLWSLAAAPWGLALLGWVGLRGVMLWRQGCMQRAVYAQATQLQTLVHNSKTLTGLARKALRLVQETEVITRGFTLVSAAGSFSRAGPGAMPQGQQLIGLRKAIYRALRSAFRASRRATCHMLKIDNVTNYVSAVPLKELGLGLGIEHMGDEQAQELTDDYSLPALKMLFQLWVGQSSECFRRLDDTSPYPGPLLHRSIAAVTEPLHRALASCLDEVQRSYDFHRHFETQLRRTGSDRTGRAREKCRELNTLHTSIRSLQLHLKALLSEMIILEDDLEKLMVSKEPPELTYEGYQELSDRLRQLHPHMQASSGCWDDTISQVERMLKRATEIPAPPSYPLILDRDPVPEELEWEACVSDSDSDGESMGPWSDMLSVEERERQRREREESRRVLSELKAVLGFRASEGERMKRKQLLFNDQGLHFHTSHSSRTESSDPALDAVASLGSVETDEEGNHLSERPEGELDGTLACGRGGGGASELHQYDGVPEEGEGQNGLDCFLSPKVPALSVMDRLTEIHGSEALSFGSALAAQVAARSHSLITMAEQTFGDDEEEDDEEEIDGQTADRD
uniref:Vezatin n=1 Tax=Mola mola TaxID=94237 RepID=A0A3Q3WKF5_MOLML